MAQIRVNLREMADFSRKLIAFREQLVCERKLFMTNAQEAGGYWEDEDYRHFLAECRTLEAELLRFDKEFVKRIDYLLNKEQAGRAALGFRF